MGTGKEINKIYEHDEDVHNTRAASIILPIIFAHIKPDSLLDVGCGLGTWLQVGGTLGVKDFLGVEGQHTNLQKVVIPIEKIIVHDLTKPLRLGRKFKIALCLEVAEHLPADSADTLITSLADHSDIIIFSAATVGQGGQNHLHERRLSYWVEKFAALGYSMHDFIRPQIWNDHRVEIWYRQNIVLFSRNNDALRETLNSNASSATDIIHPELFEYYSRQAARATMYEQGKIGVRLGFGSFLNSLINLFR